MLTQLAILEVFKVGKGHNFILLCAFLVFVYLSVFFFSTCILKAST